MRPRLEERVKEEWVPEKVCLKKIADLCEANKTVDGKLGSPVKGQKGKRSSHEQRVAFHEDIIVAIIGTVFKQQPEKPSILLELSEDNPMVPVVPKQKYISDKDYILMEDETTRVRLVALPGCGLVVDEIVNGLVCAVKGKPTIDGKFEVADVIWATPKPAPELKLKLPMEIEMIFVSGLMLGEPGSEESVFVDLLFQYLEGLAGSLKEQSCEIAHQTRVFFLGNSLWRRSNLLAESFSDDLIKNAKTLDSLLDDLSKTMEVFIMPGKNDPCETMMPQPAIHKCIMPKSSRRKSFHSLTNPTRLSMGFPAGQKLDMILNSGENVVDALRNSSLTCPLEMSRRILQWGHLCPTSPDTLPLYPGCSEDFFIINGTLPHIFAVGNQSKFDVIEWNLTKIVSVPEFSKTYSAVVLTKDLEFIELNFRAMLK
ncbi:unnamed protein product [Allacma fusca]|uniref:DNA polymerase delta small subunit n=1 Tax=Allacma fusca TaxID=39272 RepID=A0A8J2KSS4_9HEXA|nr:unnamed protein product [Allacma fusca]